MSVADAQAITGKLSEPTKMPGRSYSLPAAECATGGKLREIEGSTCHKCYAMKGRYTLPAQQGAMYRRLRALDHPQWVEAMAALIRKQSPDYFRWHDSGDLQSVEHLRKINVVAQLTPGTRHWLPTREYRIVRDYLQQYGAFADNLLVRLSAHMIGGHAPTGAGLPVSTVNVSGAGVHVCPARHQGNRCGDCRACWSADVRHVSYPLH